MSSMCPADTEVRKGSRSALSGQLTASAVFSRDGRCIYLGQTRGLLSVLDANSLQFLDVVKVRGPAACCSSCQLSLGVALSGNSCASHEQAGCIALGGDVALQCTARGTQSESLCLWAGRLPCLPDSGSNCQILF